MPPPLAIPPLIPHVRYGFRHPHPDWLFFGAARQALKFLARNLLSEKPSLRFVLPAYTCDSVVQALGEAGAPMTFVDIDDTLDFDQTGLSDAMARLSGAEVAIISTPLLGAPVRNYKALYPECVVIEDRAQALPDADSHADFQLFSFGPGKQISGMGGGALQGAMSLRRQHGALESECNVASHMALSLAGNLLLGPAWSLVGQKVTERHTANALDKEARSIELFRLCDTRARWISHSLSTWDGAGRSRTSDTYRNLIPPTLQFDLPPGRPYLRFPVRAQLKAPGVSSGRMYEKVVQRAEASAGRTLPGARAIMEASFLPTHHRVTAGHVSWYAERLSEMVVA